MKIFELEIYDETLTKIIFSINCNENFTEEDIEIFSSDINGELFKIPLRRINGKKQYNDKLYIQLMFVILNVMI